MQNTQDRTRTYTGFANRATTVGFVIVLHLAGSPARASDAPFEVAWSEQFGTDFEDAAWSVATDDHGGVFVAGGTHGSLGGPGMGPDAFLAKFDAEGALLWTRQLGTPSQEDGLGNAVDGDGNCIISGNTYGSLGGPNPQPGWADVFVAKYSNDGDLRWIRQIGTESSERCWSVTTDAHNDIFICGNTGGDLGGPSAGRLDTFVAKFDGDGNLLWLTQIGTSDWDHAHSVAVNALGEVFTTGFRWPEPSTVQPDATLNKFDRDGNYLWTRRLGAPDLFDVAYDVVADDLGNAFITGYTYSDLGGRNAGHSDIFLAKFDSNGDQVWIQQIGTDTIDRATSVVLDASDDLFVSGYTWGSLGGPNLGVNDAFLAKFDNAGTFLWARQIGTPDLDAAESVAIDRAGNAYICGATCEYERGSSVGDCDASVTKFIPPHAPCVADLTGDDHVDSEDLMLILAGWGPCPTPPSACVGDIDHSGMVNIDDLLTVISTWGPCR